MERKNFLLTNAEVHDVLRYQYSEKHSFIPMYGEKRDMLTVKVRKLGQDYYASPAQWSPTFVDQDGRPSVVSTFWVKQTYLVNGKQYDLFNHLIFENRSSQHIVLLAKRHSGFPISMYLYGAKQYWRIL